MTQQFIFTPMTAADTDALIRTIYGEARNQSAEGQRAVLCVIRNRAVAGAAYEKAHHKAHPLFGDGSIYKACHIKAQFSCWNKDDPNYSILSILPPAGKPYKDLKARVIEWLNQDDIIDGATHYCTKAVAHDTSWTYDATQTAEIGAHVFFKDVG